MMKHTQATKWIYCRIHGWFKLGNDFWEPCDACLHIDIFKCRREDDLYKGKS